MRLKYPFLRLPWNSSHPNFFIMLKSRTKVFREAPVTWRISATESVFFSARAEIIRAIRTGTEPREIVARQEQATEHMGPRFRPDHVFECRSSGSHVPDDAARTRHATYPDVTLLSPRNCVGA